MQPTHQPTREIQNQVVESIHEKTDDHERVEIHNVCVCLNMLNIVIEQVNKEEERGEMWNAFKSHHEVHFVSNHHVVRSNLHFRNLPVQNNRVVVVVKTQENCRKAISENYLFEKQFVTQKQWS